MDQPDVTRTEQLRDQLTSMYSYPLKIEKPGEVFRQYTQEAMENFGNPNNDYIDEESDFGQDTAEADMLNSMRSIMRRGDTMRRQSREEIRKQEKESEQHEFDKTRKRPCIFGAYSKARLWWDISISAIASFDSIS